MSNRRSVTKKSGSAVGKSGDLALDVARLAKEADVDPAVVYAYLCGGGGGVSGGSDWLDHRVQVEDREYLRFLDS